MKTLFYWAGHWIDKLLVPNNLGLRARLFSALYQWLMRRAF